VPSTYSSGGKTYHGRITKQGNKWLRWALAEASRKVLQQLLFQGNYLRLYIKFGRKKDHITKKKFAFSGCPLAILAFKGSVCD